MTNLPASSAPQPAIKFPPGIAFIDGEYCPMSEAKISVLDWGFLRSDATYDVVHVWQRRFFRLDRHLDRFFDSVAKIRLKLPYDREEISEILKSCVRRSGLNDAYVEMICTRGYAPDFSRDPRAAVNRFIAFAIPFSSVANEEQRRRGLDMAVASVFRIPPRSVDPTVKNYHWLDLVMALYQAYDRDAENVILLDDVGQVTEGPGFNIFAVKDSRIATPPSGVLHGITRATALELAGELGLAAEARALTVDDLWASHEVFITSTAGGIMPVRTIEGRRIGPRCPGPVTEQLTELYWQKHEDPAWSTAID